MLKCGAEITLRGCFGGCC